MYCLKSLEISSWSLYFWDATDCNYLQSSADTEYSRLEKLMEVRSPNSVSKQIELRGQNRMLSALSTWAWKLLRTDCTCSLLNLSHCLTLFISSFFPITSRASCASVLFKKQFCWPFAVQMCVHRLCYFSICCFPLFISEWSLVRFTSLKYTELEYINQAKLIWEMFFLLSPAFSFCQLLSCWSIQFTLTQNPEYNNLQGTRKHHYHSVC